MEHLILSSNKNTDYLPEYILTRWGPDYIRFLNQFMSSEGVLIPVEIELDADPITNPLKIYVKNILFSKDYVYGYYKSNVPFDTHIQTYDFSSISGSRGKNYYLYFTYTYTSVYAEPQFNQIEIDSSNEDLDAWLAEPSNSDKIVFARVYIPSETVGTVGFLTLLNINKVNIKLSLPSAFQNFSMLYFYKSFFSNFTDGVIKDIEGSFNLQLASSDKTRLLLEGGLLKSDSNYWSYPESITFDLLKYSGSTYYSAVLLGINKYGIIEVLYSTPVTIVTGNWIANVTPPSVPSGFTPLWFFYCKSDGTQFTILSESLRDLRQYSYSGDNGLFPEQKASVVLDEFKYGLNPWVPDGNDYYAFQIVDEPDDPYRYFFESIPAQHAFPSPYYDLDIGGPSPGGVSQKVLKIQMKPSSNYKLYYKYDLYLEFGSQYNFNFKLKTNLPHSVSYLSFQLGIEYYDNLGNLLLDDSSIPDWPSTTYTENTWVDFGGPIHLLKTVTDIPVSYIRFYINISNSHTDLWKDPPKRFWFVGITDLSWNLRKETPDIVLIKTQKDVERWLGTSSVAPTEPLDNWSWSSGKLTPAENSNIVIDGTGIDLSISIIPVTGLIFECLKPITWSNTTNLQCFYSELSITPIAKHCKISLWLSGFGASNLRILYSLENLQFSNLDIKLDSDLNCSELAYVEDSLGLFFNIVSSISQTLSTSVFNKPTRINLTGRILSSVSLINVLKDGVNNRVNLDYNSISYLGVVDTLE